MSRGKYEQAEERHRVTARDTTIELNTNGFYTENGAGEVYRLRENALINTHSNPPYNRVNSCSYSNIPDWALTPIRSEILGSPLRPVDFSRGEITNSTSKILKSVTL